MAMAASSGASVKQSITSGKGMADNRISVAEGVSHPPLKNIETGFLCASGCGSTAIPLYYCIPSKYLVYQYEKYPYLPAKQKDHPRAQAIGRFDKSKEFIDERLSDMSTDMVGHRSTSIWFIFSNE